MSQQTYLFYDIETTGLNKCFDQVLQFAAIRTDMKLNEIERYEINIKLNLDIIPSPFAIITHRIGIEQSQQGESEYEAIQKIHTLLNTPGTISLGYNTLGFDDEFLRFSFYRNLLTPYTHQFANNCSRMDIYPMTLMYYLFKNEILEWPEVDGKTSMKLENINATNQLATGQAHDAMVDVEVTLALAKKLFQDQQMWQYVTQYFHKPTDEHRFIQTKTHQTIGNHTIKMGMMINGKFGSDDQYISPVIHCGTHQHYKNQSIWLRLDKDNLFEENFPIKKRFGEAPIFLPFLDRYLNMIDDQRKNQLQKNLRFLSKHPDEFLSHCQKLQKEKYPAFPTRDIDAGLYDIGFPSRDESLLCQQFHRVSLKEKSNFIEKLKPNYKEQAIRILGRMNKNLLSPSQKMQFNDYLENKILIDYQGKPKYDLKQATKELEEIQKNMNLDSQQITLMQSYQKFIERISITH